MYTLKYDTTDNIHDAEVRTSASLDSLNQPTRDTLIPLLPSPLYLAEATGVIEVVVGGRHARFE